MKALYGPYRMVRFIPTGGIDLKSFADYADKPYIHAIGGGWLCNTTDINANNFDVISEVVKELIDVLLGFELAHIGINVLDEEESLKIAKMFAAGFGFAVKQGSSSNFSGVRIEVSKSIGLGAKGHIGIQTNSIERAAYYLSKRGYTVDWSTRKGPEAKPMRVYSKEEFGGFAIHLLQK